MKKLVAVFLTVFVLLGVFSQASACTGVVVGKDVSANGSLIVSRNEDLMNAYNKTFFVNPATDGEGMTTVVDEINGFTWDVPAAGVAWTMVNDVPEHGDGLYPEMCLNTYGVLVSASFAQSVNEDVLAADPYVADGLRQAYLPCVVAPFAKTAREGVQMVGQVIEQKGSAESHIIFIADSNECWVMEILSGHTWAAQKVPDDKFIVVANAHILGYIDTNDTDNYLCSPNLFSMPEEKGFLKTHNGQPHLALTYGKGVSASARPRYWGGQKYFAASQDISYDAEVFEAFLTPDEPIELIDVMGMLGYRYEGTEHDANVTGERAIGGESTCESHIFEYKPNGLVTGWLCMGSVENNIFLPFYPALSETPAAYQVEGEAFHPDSAYWTFKGLATLANVSREYCAPGVKAYWAQYQQQLIDKMNATEETYLSLNPEEAETFANQMFAEISADALSAAKQMTYELMYYLAENASMTKTPKAPFSSALLSAE